jgi:putative nucleotidyltransferase with HDIG domain
MNDKIQQIKNKLANEIKSSKHCDPWLYEEHILVVEKLALELCDLYPKANRDAVILSVWFHDIGRAHGYNEDHDLYGANYANKILIKNNFDKNFIKLITESCKTHSCDKNGKPNSLEGKILATADAISHYHNGFYLRILYSWSKKNKDNYHKLREKLFEKMKRDLNEKIFFDKIKKQIKPIYKSWEKITDTIKLT